MGAAKITVSKTAVGGMSGMQATTSNLADFQAEVAELQRLEIDGDIQITLLHKEDQTGNRYVDLVKFKRLK